MYAFLLLCFISIFACLDLGFCHALCPLWVYACRSLGPLACVVASHHLWDISLWCWCAWYTPSSASCDVVMLALLALCHPFSFLCFFVSLHTCLRVHAWVCASLVLHSHWTMDTRSKSTFVLLRHPLFFFYNMLVCPHLASFASLSFSMLSFYLLLFLFVGLFLLLLHVHTWSMDTWVRVWPPRHKQNMARMQARRRKPIKGNVQ